MLALVLALAAAAVFGAATALQHDAASSVQRSGGTGRRLLAALLRRPGWVLGLCLSGVAFALHVAALQHGPLALVQPLVMTTAVFAVLVSSALDRTLPDRAEVWWCVCTCAGLALFVASVRPRPHPVAPDHGPAAVLLVAAVGASVVLLVVSRRLGSAVHRGFVLGVAAGVLYGSTAGLIKAATFQARFGTAAVAAYWPTWLVVPFGLSAFLLSQRAYHATRLSASVPAANIVDVLVSVGFGAVVFGQPVDAAPLRLAAQLVGLAMAGVGVWRLVLESERLHERKVAVARARADVPVTGPQ